MGYGQDAFAIASHATMIVVLVLLGYRVMRLFPDIQLLTRAESHGLSAALAIATMAMVIERAYYVAARLLSHHGLNLWSLHPAPEVLSMVVVIGLFLCFVPLRMATGEPSRRIWIGLGVEWIALLLFWVLIVVVLL
jgi:hypothetical protein